MKYDLLLDSNHDLVIEDFDLKLTNSKEVLQQKLKQELLMFRGDWFLDIDAGIPYYQDILGQRNSIDAVRAIFIHAIRKVEEVKEIVSIDLNLNGENRTLEIKISVLDEFSNILNIEI